MKTDRRIRSAAGGLALIVLMILSSLRLLLPLSADAADDMEQQRQAILSAQSGGQPLQQWLDGDLTAGAGKGASEWYVMALAAAGERLDFSAYLAALNGALDRETLSATAKQRCALALIAASGTVPQRCETLLAESIGKQGIMSWIFGLHLINNRVRSDVSSAEAAGKILSGQCADGGWSIAGTYGDPDVTAMALQALAPYQAQQEVGTAVRNALAFLSQKQLADGGFSSYGTENPESTAQVWIALNALDISPLTDARFVKNGKTLYDAVEVFDLGGGQYAHQPGGAANPTAEMQVFLALTAQNISEKDGHFYLLHGASPKWESREPQQTTAAPPASETVSRTRTTAAGSTQTAASSVSGTTFSESTENWTDETVPQTKSAAESTESAEIRTAQSTEQTVTSYTSADTETTLSGTVTAADSPPPEDGSFAYRVPLTAALWGVFAVIAVILWLRKRRSIKSYLTLAALFALLTAGVWLLNLRTPEQYYQAQSRTGGGSVTMEIRCDVICGMPGSERFPADGIILPETVFSIEEGENALTLLYDAVRANSLQIEVDGVSGDVVETAYVRGIASLYEFDFGDLSGWTYKVNGERPAVGCGAFTLHDGDCVVWEYTVNL